MRDFITICGIVLLLVVLSGFSEIMLGLRAKEEVLPELMRTMIIFGLTVFVSVRLVRFFERIIKPEDR